MTRKRKSPEGDFQAKLVRDLRRILTPDVFMTHFPSGGGGTIRGALLKLRGLVPGVPDLLFIHQGQAYWMELKDRYRKPSDTQIECRRALRAAGSYVETIHTLDEALVCLAIWNIPTRLKSLPSSTEGSLEDRAGARGAERAEP